MEIGNEYENTNCPKTIQLGMNVGSTANCNSPNNVSTESLSSSGTWNDDATDEDDYYHSR